VSTEGIVLELQRDCLEASVSVSGILRKAKAIASKLELNDLTEWINSELNGYECGMAELPPHRVGVGAPKFWNPYNGYCPIMTDGGTIGDILRTVYLPQSVAELEELAKGDGKLIMQYSPQIQNLIQEQMPVRMEAGLHFSKSQILAALDFVRNKTLEWTLELEKRGISGEKFTFDLKQKREAQIVTNHIYGGNVGVLGSVSGDANNTGFFAAGNDLSIEKISGLSERIREALPGLPRQTIVDMQEPLEALENEERSSTPSKGKVAAALTSMQKVLEGAAGNLAATGILSAIATAI
jgi:AbiTii